MQSQTATSPQRSTTPGNSMRNPLRRLWNHLSRNRTPDANPTPSRNALAVPPFVPACPQTAEGMIIPRLGTPVAPPTQSRTPDTTQTTNALSVPERPRTAEGRVIFRPWTPVPSTNALSVPTIPERPRTADGLVIGRPGFPVSPPRMLVDDRVPFHFDGGPGNPILQSHRTVSLSNVDLTVDTSPADAYDSFDGSGGFRPESDGYRSQDPVTRHGSEREKEPLPPLTQHAWEPTAADRRDIRSRKCRSLTKWQK